MDIRLLPISKMIFVRLPATNAWHCHLLCAVLLINVESWVCELAHFFFIDFAYNCDIHEWIDIVSPSAYRFGINDTMHLQSLKDTFISKLNQKILLD